MKLLPDSNLYIPDVDQHFTKPRKRGGYAWQAYQQDHIDAALAHVPADRRRVAVDIGAHVGLLTRYLATQFEKVLAFEPDPKNFECLVENTKDLPNVKRYNNAVGETACMVDMSAARPDNTGDRQIVLEAGPVQQIALDSLFLAHVDFVKMDVQGYEYYVIAGAINTLRYCRPVCMVEVEPPESLALQFKHDAKTGLTLLKHAGAGELQRVGADRIWGFPPVGENIEFDKYDKFGEYHWDKYRGAKQFLANIETLVTQIQRYPHEQLLDVGCGDGLYTCLLQAQGIDTSQTAIELAQAHGVTCQRMSLFDINQFEHRWDAICMFDVLEHLYDQEAALQVLGSWTDRLHILNPERNPGAIGAYHTREFTHTELREWMRLQGWTCCEDTTLPLPRSQKHLMTFEK